MSFKMLQSSGYGSDSDASNAGGVDRKRLSKLEREN